MSVVRTLEQVKDFKDRARALIAEIREVHGASVTVHVFPALPNSLAVEFGKCLLPKADPRIEVYDFDRSRGGFMHALTLTGAPPVSPVREPHLRPSVAEPASAPTERL